ncbi:MAG: NAD-dependent deacylase [Bacteroidales bacterium]|nr:NAD-dependent deacylase [Bacteroidales bacterium]
MMDQHQLKKAAEWLVHSSHNTGFTGAGISVESGIPPFRGENGLWNKYDPGILDLSYFYSNPEKAWEVISSLFYDFFGSANPNAAHEGMAELEQMGLLDCVITQNIDNLHQEAGSSNVYEFHGNSRNLVCQQCDIRYPAREELLEPLPPRCERCGSVLKPDFIFFGEMIPQLAYQKSMEEATHGEIFILVGTTGEIMPASMIPQIAKENGLKIIEVNPNYSHFTGSIADIFLQGKATEVFQMLLEEIKKRPEIQKG